MKYELDNIAFAYEPTVIFRAQPDWLYGREPLLRRMPDGSLICLISTGGPTEPHDDNVIAATRSYDDGVTWSKPEVLFDHQTRGVWAFELFAEQGDPCIFVHTYDAASHYLELKTFRSWSKDSGRTWSEPVSVPGGVGNVSVRQGIVLASGDWVFPVYWQETLGRWNWQKKGKEKGGRVTATWRFVTGVLRSEDAGQSFRLCGNVRADFDLWEPNAVEVAPNRLVMLIRQTGAPAPGVLYRSDSADGGLSWSAPRRTNIPDPSAKLTLLKLGDAVILLHNANSERRTPLSLWVSHDGCETWPVQLDLAAHTQGGKICYPHAFVDHEKELLYVACDAYQAFYLLKVPFADFLGAS
jgi:predicted neuraminidase